MKVRDLIKALRAFRSDDEVAVVLDGMFVPLDAPTCRQRFAEDGNDQSVVVLLEIDTDEFP